MDAFVIQGGRPLRGTVKIHGSKNAALPLMAAALVTDLPLTLRGVPDLADIRNMQRLLQSLGVEVTRADHSGGGGDLAMRAADPSKRVAHYDIVRTMRAGICVLGPLLGMHGQAQVSMPGGCAIGDRPVDLHIRGLKALGAKIELDAGYIHATGPNGPGSRLVGAHVFLGGPMGSTVLGTANVMTAAVLARGTTIIESAACEPEVVDLADLLNAMGARIIGAGSPTVTIEGVDKLSGADHHIIPDRIEAGTYVCAAAITAGDVVLTNFPTAMLTAFLDRLRIVGVTIEPANADARQANSHDPTPQTQDPSLQTHTPGIRDTVRVVAQRRLMPVQVVTQPHPGFPTDLQAQAMALLTLADGNAIITEKIFPDRFMHVPELLRMNAQITRTGTSAVITGTRELVGAPVMASDLRASAGLVIAGLAARGTTQVNRVYHLDRGYQQMELTLQELGAQIERVDDKML